MIYSRMMFCINDPTISFFFVLGDIAPENTSFFAYLYIHHYYWSTPSVCPLHDWYDRFDRSLSLFVRLDRIQLPVLNYMHLANDSRSSRSLHPKVRKRYFHFFLYHSFIARINEKKNFEWNWFKNPPASFDTRNFVFIVSLLDKISFLQL